MQVEISKEALKKVNEASKALGIKDKELIDRAILVYIDNLGKYIALKDELEAWDALSDEALTNFEKSL